MQFINNRFVAIKLLHCHKEPKPKHFGPDIFGGGGVFHVKGWGPKSSACPSKPRDTKHFGGISRDFAGISQVRPKSLKRKKVCVQFSSPNCSQVCIAGCTSGSCPPLKGVSWIFLRRHRRNRPVCHNPLGDTSGTSRIAHHFFVLGESICEIILRGGWPPRSSKTPKKSKLGCFQYGRFVATCGPCMNFTTFRT